MNDAPPPPLPTLDLASELKLAGLRVAWCLLAFSPLAARAGRFAFENLAGDLSFAFLAALGLGGVALVEERGARRGANPWVLGGCVALGWMLLVPLLGVQALYSAEVASSGSLTGGFSVAYESIERLADEEQLIGLWIGLCIASALTLGLRFSRISHKQKTFYAGACILAGLLAVCGFALGAIDPYFDRVIFNQGWRRSDLTVALSILACGFFPATAVWAERRAGAPALRPRRRPTKADKPLLVAVGAVLPLLAFLLNETGFGPGEGPDWAEPLFRTWHALLLTAEVQRPLYPLLLFCVAAFLASLQGRRQAWISAGLACGVALSALYCAVYVDVIPIGFVAILFFGVGLLGLSPVLVFMLYSHALFKDLKTRRPEHAAAQRRWLAGLALFFSYAAWRVTVRAVEAHARLPTSPPDDCYVATASARASTWTRALPVRFPDGQVAPVSRQLRVLKAGELVLARGAPRLHRALRWVYDRVGPPLARRMGPIGGALAWGALLVPQATCALALRLLGADLERLLARVYPGASAARQT